jgi:hypothetical protein
MTYAIVLCAWQGWHAVKRRESAALNSTRRRIPALTPA